MSDSKQMTILGHLLEFRKRLIISAIAVLATTLASFFFYNRIIEFLKRPAGNTQFIFIEVTESFSLYMQVCLTMGVMLAIPVITYQFLRFVMPALHPREKRMVLLVTPWAFIMFIGGVVFGYYFLIPPATKFLLNFGSNLALVQPRMSNYINFIMKMLLTIGLVFETPVITTFLARMGIISYRWLASKRRWWILIAFVLAAIITPTPDAVNQTIVAGTLIVLLEVSIWLAWFVERGKKKTQQVS